MKKGERQWLNLFLIFIFLITSFTPVFAFDFSIRPKVFVFIPTGDGNTDPLGNTMYDTGAGGEIGFEVDFSTIFPNPIGLGYTLGVEGGLVIMPFQNDSKSNINFYSAGGVLGLYYFPLSRLFVRADGAVGAYIASSGKGNSDPGLFLRFGGEAGFRFTPSLLVAANAGWREYQLADGGLLNSGVYIGITLQLTFQMGSNRSEGISTALVQHDDVYPAFIAIYQNNPIGSVTVRNNENAEIRNVRIYFRAKGYTSSEFLCSSVSIIPRGHSVEVPLLADFSNEILRFTDSGRIIGEFVIRYRFLGKERETVRAVTVAAHDRNSVTANDTTALAAFVSVSSPEVLDFAKIIAGLERNNRRIGHNQGLSYAIWAAEALRVSQLEIKNNKLETDKDKMQFPAETLLFGSGSASDVALLFASCLESVGIGSALIQTDEELLVAVSLGVNQSGAETLVNGTDKILVVGDSVYLPLSISALKDGFIASWSKGASVLNNVFSSGGECEIIVIQEAWRYFPSAPLPELGRSNIKIDNSILTREANNAVQQYIQQEIDPLIQKIGSAPSNAAQQNRMGILYARSGRIPEAKAAYERAAGMGSVPAMNNRGNLALIERDYDTAERWFMQVLSKDERNRTAQRGMERVAANKF